jgi:hypothetical protein
VQSLAHAGFIMDTHPPRPRVALAVGIVGHRPNRLPSEQTKLAAIAKESAVVLAAIGREAVAAHNLYKDYFSGQQPIIAAISALAEGADRLGAHSALAQAAARGTGADFQLDIPLPFSVDVYKNDFKTEDSKFEFDTLLRQARSVLILPGERGRPDDSDQKAQLREKRAYEDAGLTLLNQSDVLLAVWDGEAGAGRGGTHDLLDIAAQSGTPIIHIDAKCQRPTRILWNGLDRFPAAPNAVDDLPAENLDTALSGLIDKLLCPPEAAHDVERSRLKSYYDRRLWLRNFGLAFPMLMALLQVRERRHTDWRPPRPEALAADLVRFDRSEPPNTKLQQTSVLATAYSWSDAWGVWLAQVFRSAFVMNFSFAAFAVILAALSLVWTDIEDLATKLGIAEMARELAWHKVPFVLVELILIASVLGVTTAGNRKGWHHRWIEAREVAERLRMAFPLWALGLRPTTFPVEEPAWTGWYTRAIVREQGMRPAILDAAGLQQARATLRDLLADQCSYHRSTEVRMEKMERRLERTGIVLLTLTLLALIAFPLILILCSVLGYDMPLIRISFAVTGIAAGLPALGTATFGIRVIGDFDGIARRSKRTYEMLQRIIDAIDAEDPPSVAALRTRARAASDIMLGDVSTWRLGAESRTLAIPG